MADPKPFASLSSGLLARKGAARPAMRPQGFGQLGGGLEDLGWDDMGFEAPKPTAVPRDSSHDAFGEEFDEDHPRVHPTGLTPIQSPLQSPVHSQQAELADRLGLDDEDEEYDETAELYDLDAESDEAKFEAEEVDDEFGTEEALEAVEDEPFELLNRYEEPAAIDEPAPAYQPTSAYHEAPADEQSPVYEPAPVYEQVPVLKRPAVYQPAQRSTPGTKSKAAFTLRLDPDRHLKLRLACAVNGRSAQQIVTDAVDQLLREMPELDALAEKAKRRG